MYCKFLNRLCETDNDFSHILNAIAEYFATKVNNLKMRVAFFTRV